MCSVLMLNILQFNVNPKVLPGNFDICIFNKIVMYYVVDLPLGEIWRQRFLSAFMVMELMED